MNKRILVYVGFLFYILLNIVLNIFNIIDFNTLSLTITIIACIGGMLPFMYHLIDDYAENKRNKKVEKIESRDYDVNLMNDLEIKLNLLKENACIIDSIQIHDTVGYTDNRKEIYIIYH